MSRGLSNYSGSELERVVDRRLRHKGGGNGTLAAQDYRDKQEWKRIQKLDKAGKLKKDDIKKAVELHEKGVK